MFYDELCPCDFSKIPSFNLEIHDDYMVTADQSTAKTKIKLSGMVYKKCHFVVVDRLNDLAL